MILHSMVLVRFLRETNVLKMLKNYMKYSPESRHSNMCVLFLCLTLVKDAGALICHNCTVGKTADCDGPTALQSTDAHAVICPANNYCILYRMLIVGQYTFRRRCIDTSGESIVAKILQLFTGKFPTNAKGICAKTTRGEACLCQIDKCNDFAIATLQPLFKKPGATGIITVTGEVVPYTVKEGESGSGESTGGGNGEFVLTVTSTSSGNEAATPPEKITTESGPSGGGAESADNTEDPTNLGLIIGIVAGVLGIILITGICVYCYYQRSKKQQEEDEEEEEAEDTEQEEESEEVV